MLARFSDLASESFPSHSQVLFYGPAPQPSAFKRIDRLKIKILGFYETSEESLDEASLAEFLSEQVQQLGTVRNQIETEVRRTAEKRKELEDLNQLLEKTVVERTIHIEHSAEEQSGKLNSERGLIRFIKDLSHLFLKDDLLLLIRKELRKFSFVGEPMLMYSIDQEQHSLIFFKNSSLNSLNKKSGQKPGQVIWDYPSESSISDSSASQFLATLLGRPMGRVALLPLSLTVFSQVFSSAKAMIAIEIFHKDSKNEEIANFMQFLNERKEILSMTLDRMLLENQLKLFSYRWERTFDEFADGIAIINDQYEVIRANQQFSKIRSQKNRFKKCYEQLAERHSPCPNCPMNRESREKAVHAKVYLPNQTYEVNSYAIGGEDLKLFVHQYTDVSEEEQINSQLVQNEKMGSLGLLAGHLAHELNNPLSGILSLSQVMQQQMALQPEIKMANLESDLNEIKQASQRCLAIIKNLLEFSKEGEMTPSEVSLDELVEKTLPLLKTALRNHRFFKDLQTSSALVKVNPQLVQQVIFNLIKNASQAMAQTGTIKVFSQLRKEGWVELVIEDTGPGISDELKPRIFEPFFTTKASGEGTGLGLNLSKNIVERFGGRLEFKSKVGVGTQFFVLFPISSVAKRPL